MDDLKRQAAARALEQVRDGMKLGLGTGSTAKHFVELLGMRVRDGLSVVGVPTSDRMIVIADDTKWVDMLGRFPLPVEVIPFGLAATQRAIGKAFAQAGVSGQMVVRKGKDGHVFVTDGGHWIVDAHLGRITDAPRLAGLLTSIPGVVEHGLFIGLASTAMLAGAQGIRVVERP